MENDKLIPLLQSSGALSSMIQEILPILGRAGRTTMGNGGMGSNNPTRLFRGSGGGGGVKVHQQQQAPFASGGALVNPVPGPSFLGGSS
jgi:hypothetical protein